MKARLVALVLIALVALLEPLTAEAQPAGEIRRIGFLSISPRDQVAQ